MTTPMSSGGGECRVGCAAAPWDHHRRRGAESSPPPDRHQQTIDVGRGDRPLPHTAPHKLLAQVEHPAGRSHMLVAVHGLAVRAASEAIRAPLTELLKPDCCRALPRSSHRAASAIIIGAPPPRARERAAIVVNAAPHRIVETGLLSR